MNIISYDKYINDYRFYTGVTCVISDTGELQTLYRLSNEDTCYVPEILVQAFERKSLEWISSTVEITDKLVQVALKYHEDSFQLREDIHTVLKDHI